MFWANRPKGRLVHHQTRNTSGVETSSQEKSGQETYSWTRTLGVKGCVVGTQCVRGRVRVSEEVHKCVESPRTTPGSGRWFPSLLYSRNMPYRKQIELWSPPSLPAPLSRVRDLGTRLHVGRLDVCLYCPLTFLRGVCYIDYLVPGDVASSSRTVLH